MTTTDYDLNFALNVFHHGGDTAAASSGLGSRP